MDTRFTIAAYWGPRIDGAAQVAEKTVALLERLREIDAAYACWYLTGKSKREAKRRSLEPLQVDIVLGEILKRKNRRQGGMGAEGDSLGCGLGLWNGADDDRDASSLSIIAGVSHPRLGNAIVLKPPSRMDVSSLRSRCPRILAAVAEVWEPRWGGVMSSSALMSRPVSRDSVLVDWMVYVQAPPDSIGSLSGVELLSVRNRGVVIVVHDTPISPTDAASLVAVREVEAGLRAAGIF